MLPKQTSQDVAPSTAASLSSMRFLLPNQAPQYPILVPVNLERLMTEFLGDDAYKKTIRLPIAFYLTLKNETYVTLPKKHTHHLPKCSPFLT